MAVSRVQFGQPRPCKACAEMIILVYDPDRHQWEPIEMASGMNHFHTCTGARSFGNPGKHIFNFCFKHRVFHRADRCLKCFNESHPPLDTFGGRS